MKKIVALLVLVVLVAGAYFGSIFYASKKLDDFFSHNNGKLFDRFGLTWQVTSSEKGLFSSKYETKVTFVLPTQILEIANFTHDAKFSFGFNEFGTMKSNGKMDIDLDSIKDLSSYDKRQIREIGLETKKDLNFDSVLTFDGIKTSIDIKAGEKKLFEELMVIDYSDIKGSNFISYAHDKISYSRDVPLLKISYEDNEFLTMENYKESSNFAKKNGFWFGDTKSEGSKFHMNIEDEVIYLLDDFIAKASIEKQNDKYFKFVNDIYSKEAMIKYIELDSTNKSVKNFVYNESIENLHMDKISTLFSSLSKLNLAYNEVVAGLELISLADVALKMLEEKPRYSINELSADIDDERQSASAFIQYVGDASQINIFSSSLDEHFIGGFELNIGEKLYEKILKFVATKKAEDLSDRIYSIWEIEEDILDKYLADFGVESEWDLTYKQEKEIIKLENEARKELQDSSFESSIKEYTEKFRDDLKKLGIEVKNGKAKVKFDFNKGKMTLNDKEIDEDTMDEIFE